MNIYLIAAESYRILTKEIKKIIKNNAYLNFNLNKVSIAEIIKEASYYGLGDNKKVMVVSNAYLFGLGKVNEKESMALVDYLNNPNPDTTIIFTTMEGIDLRKKVTKLIKEKYHLINMAPFSWRDKEAEIRNYVKENNFQIENEAINYILNNTASLDMIYNELDKIFLYYNMPTIIKYSDIKKIVCSLVDNNNFHFVSAVIEKNLKEALKLFHNLKVYKVEPLSLIILLAREYRNMFYLKKYQSNKLSLKDISKEMNMQDWQINKLYTNSIKYQEEELLKNLKLLADLDLGIKTGLLDKEVALMSFLMEVCGE